MLKALIFLVGIHATNGHEYFMSYAAPSPQACNVYIQTLGAKDSDYGYSLARKMRSYLATDAQTIDYTCVTTADIETLLNKYGTDYVSKTISGSPE